MDGFLSHPNEELDYHTLIQWLKAGDPRCATKLSDLPEDVRADTAATRRQTVFLLLGTAAPVRLFVNTRTGELINTAALCTAASKLLEPRRLEYHYPGMRKLGNAGAWLKMHHHGFWGGVHQQVRKASDFVQAAKPQTPSPGKVAAGTALIASLAFPSAAAAAAGSVGLPLLGNIITSATNLFSPAQLLIGGYGASTLGAYGLGREQRMKDLDKMREHTRALQKEASSGEWSLETRAQMRLHLLALRELDFKMMEVNQDGDQLVSAVIKGTRSSPSALIMASMGWKNKFVDVCKALMDAYMQSERIGDPEQALALFRKLILQNDDVNKDLRVFHFFDHRGHQRGRRGIMKAFVIQERATEKAISAYKADAGAVKAAERAAQHHLPPA